MKTFSTTLKLFFLCCIPFISQGQWINNISVVPANPTTTDTIYVYVDCSFPSGGCDQKTSSFYVTPPVITATSLHCLGMLAYICNDSDIFVIPPQPAGPYTFIFQVDAGQAPVPCTPGIVPGPVDSVTFHVTDASGIPTPAPGAEELLLVPAGKQNNFICKVPGNIRLPFILKLFTTGGQIATSLTISSNNQEIDLSGRAAGIYLATPDRHHEKGIKVVVQ